MSGVKSGLNEICLVINNCYAMSQKGKLNTNMLMESINSISDTVQNMNVINVFMLESINRFLDFSKAQKGTIDTDIYIYINVCMYYCVYI
jgi:hypothetical protein